MKTVPASGVSVHGPPRVARQPPACACPFLPHVRGQAFARLFRLLVKVCGVPWVWALGLGDRPVVVCVKVEPSVY